MKKMLAMLTAVLFVVGETAGLSSCGKKGELVVYTESGFAPFEYGQDGAIVGVDVDIMQKVADKLGKTLKFEDVKFDTIIDAVKDGKLTNVGAAGLSITDARKEKVDFSVPYYTAELYVIYKTTDAATYESTTNDGGKTGVYWDSFAGKKVGVQTGTTADLFLSDEIELDEGVLHDANATKTGYDTYVTALSDLSVGNINVIIMDEIPAQTLIKNKSEYKCAPLYYKGGEGDADEAACDEYAIAVTKGQTEILNAVNEVLNALIAEKDSDGNNGVQQLVLKHLK